MKLKGPIVTLGVGAVLAAALLVANVSLSHRDADAVAPAAATSSAPPASTTSASTTSTSATTTSATTTSATSSTSVASGSTTATGSAVAPTATATGKVTYAGEVKGGGSLAVAVSGDTAVAYFCDGRTEAWLWGSAAGGVLDLKDKAGDTLTGTATGERLTGTLTTGGRSRPVDLKPVHKPSGLYRATADVRGAKVVGGWVVLPDGSQVGAWTADGGAPRPAPALDLATGSVVLDGVRLTAAAPDPAAAS